MPSPKPRKTSYGDRSDWFAAPQTKLNAVRRSLGVPQAELARVTGISQRTLSRLENGELTNPPLRYIVNCALALGVPWQELIEPEWERWDPGLRGPNAEPLPEARATPSELVHRI